MKRFWQWVISPRGVYSVVLGLELGVAIGSTIRGWYWTAALAGVLAFGAAWALDRANAKAKKDEQSGV